MHTTSAIFYSIINLASKGDNIVSARALYGGTFTMFNDLLPKFGIEVRFVDAEDPQNFERAMDDKTRAFFCESVSNPALEICDLEVIGASAHDHGLPLICDSTFSTVSVYLFFRFSYGTLPITNIYTFFCSPTCASHSSMVVTSLFHH